MKFSCEKAILLSAINTASRAVSSKSSIPALEGLLLQGEDTLTVSGYNMQTGIRTKVDAEVTQGGTLVVNARLFGDIIRRMPDDVIVFDADEKFIEEEGRRIFLMFLRPIINGAGNYYIEAQTRDKSRTDVIVDYRGRQFIIELKLWKGTAYEKKGRQDYEKNR